MPKHFILHVHVSKPAEEDIQGKPWYPTHLRSSIAYVNLKTFNLIVASGLCSILYNIDDFSHL